jgi:hypothetical protein
VNRRSAKHIFFALLAAATLGVAVAGSASCAHRTERAPETEPKPSTDTVALVEGLRLFEEGRYALAREQLLVSAASPGAHIRAESYLYLNALEMELGNYDAARPWLEKYHSETVRLLRQSAEASARMEQQAARLRKRNDTLVVGILSLVAAAGVAFVFVRRRRLGRETTNGSPADTAIERSPEWEKWLADVEVFKRTDIYAEIVELGAQTPGREARVLTLTRQQVLDGVLADVFSDFGTRLREEYPALTAGDVKLCCLSLAGLSPFARALCYGSTETNIVKQRKHTIKRKLAADARGRGLFEFIFKTI